MIFTAMFMFIDNLSPETFVIMVSQIIVALGMFVGVLVLLVLILLSLVGSFQCSSLLLILGTDECFDDLI